MTGIVVVSHSYALGRAAADLALEMVPEHSPRVVLAAGLTETALGTDPAAIATSIEAAMDEQGVVVLLDLGSAIRSTRSAIDRLPAEVSRKVHPTAAPFVEGLVGAVVAASTGAGPEAVIAEALRGVRAKQQHLEGVTNPPPE